MEEVDESETSWLHELDDKLAKGLLAVDILSPEANAPPHDSLVNKLISTVYSGPTISDIENALAMTYCGSSSEPEGQSRVQSIVSVPERGHSKTDNKYTLKIRSCGNGPLAADGYKWKKYGQKSIKNSPNPRSYYRCTNPRCNAKKQMERSIDDPETLNVTYEGLHLHYTYSHFLLAQPQKPLPTSGLPSTKKPKIQTSISEDRHNEEDKTHSPGKGKEHQQQESRVVGADNPQEGHKKDSVTTTDTGIRKESMQHPLLLEEQQSPQGLLEDIVPLLVRKPCSSTTSSNEPSSPSQISSPSYSSSLSWSPTDFYFDVGILSNIM